MTGQLITSKQNEPEYVKRLAAKKQLYLMENRLNAAQMLLAISVALGGALIQAHITGSEPYVTIVAAVVALIDALIFERQKGSWQQLAAKIQEQFDCVVLNLPWRTLKAGAEPKPEATAEYCKRYFDDPEERKKLVDWYPGCVQDLPFQAARIVCQRENCIYDARLREGYIKMIVTGLVVLSAVTLTILILVNDSVVESLAGMVAPLIPAFVIGFREIKQNKDALEASNRLLLHVEELAEMALNKSATDEEFDGYSRFLQDEIFDNRRRSPVIFDWYYSIHRSRNEALLVESATEFTTKYKERNQ